MGDARRTRCVRCDGLGALGTSRIVGSMADSKDLNLDFLKDEEVVFCGGCFCCHTGFYCTPDCCGVAGEFSICCLVGRSCCKTGTRFLCFTPPEGEYFQIGIGFCSLGCKENCDICFAGQYQLCCIYNSITCP